MGTFSHVPLSLRGEGLSGTLCFNPVFMRIFGLHVLRELTRRLVLFGDDFSFLSRRRPSCSHRTFPLDHFLSWYPGRFTSVAPALEKLHSRRISSDPPSPFRKSRAPHPVLGWHPYGSCEPPCFGGVPQPGGDPPLNSCPPAPFPFPCAWQVLRIRLRNGFFFPGFPETQFPGGHRLFEGLLFSRGHFDGLPLCLRSVGF